MLIVYVTAFLITAHFLLLHVIVVAAAGSHKPLMMLVASSTSSTYPAPNLISRRWREKQENGIPGDQPNAPSATPDINEMCHRLEGNHQRHMCEERGAGELIRQGALIAAGECRRHFSQERWNCSLEPYYTQTIINKGLRESAVMYALSSAGLVHSVARACSQQRHSAWCSCDASLSPAQNKQAWLWGGCGDNIRHAVRFSHQLLDTEEHTWGRRLGDRVNLHNTRAGIKVVQKGMHVSCKCHGVSGSCSVKTCWRQLAPFHHTAAILKRKYQRAKRVTDNSAGGQSLVLRRQKQKTDINSYINQNSHKPQQTQRSFAHEKHDKKNKKPKPKGEIRTRDLVYIRKSPNFCERSVYSAGTKDRKCESAGACHVMCCGRGHNVRVQTINKVCRCRVHWCCNVVCDICSEEVDVYTCK